MTTLEFKEAFNTLYNNINSMASPGFDDYEISLLLTLAQEELVKNYNDPTSNIKQEGFEGSDKRRIDLKELITDYKITGQLSSPTYRISQESVIYQIPNNVFLIKQEQATVLLDCGNNRIVSVIPKTHDEYNRQIKNPFKKPNSNKVWRLDYNSSEPGTNIVELISSQLITEYHMRYLKFPDPIIISNLTDGLTINGFTSSRTSELNREVHSEIVRRAVELSKLSYKEDSLGNFVDLYKRKE
jgi:hypothetical protein|tara:strand:+ start:19212 stop:19937 length:726 start_codon:yes stop_codon:yes gene_type:complete